MRLFWFSICLVLAALGFYFFVSKSSSEESLSSILTKEIGPDGKVSLDACNLKVVVETEGKVLGPSVFIRVVIRADLRNYIFDPVQILPKANQFNLLIGRKPVNDRILAQAIKIANAGGEEAKQAFRSANATDDIWKDEARPMSFHVMAEVIKTKAGEEILTPHKDAPAFYRFAEAVDSLSDPVSYRSTTTFSSRKTSAETLLTGEISLIPPLSLSLGSEDQAKLLAQAFYNYAAANDCN